jgi:hypothetical protein
MSTNEPTPQIDPDYTPEYKTFAFVVGTDVGWTIRVDTRVEQAIAVLLSNPIVVLMPDELISDHYLGWSYDAGVFTAPE